MILENLLYRRHGLCLQQQYEITVQSSVDGAAEQRRQCGGS